MIIITITFSLNFFNNKFKFVQLLFNLFSTFSTLSSEPVFQQFSNEEASLIIITVIIIVIITVIIIKAGRHRQQSQFLPHPVQVSSANQEPTPLSSS